MEAEVVERPMTRPVSTTSHHTSSKPYNRHGEPASQAVSPREIVRPRTKRAEALRDMYLAAKSPVNVELTYCYARAWAALEGELPAASRPDSTTRMRIWLGSRSSSPACPGTCAG